MPPVASDGVNEKKHEADQINQENECVGPDRRNGYTKDGQSRFVV
jgi:hypothetical protein